MKKIILAWIEQVLEFDSTADYNIYLTDLDRKGQKYDVTKHEVLDSGVVKVRIRKQYNNNQFPNSKGV